MSTQLKICGITNQDDAKACYDLGVDFLGFNFFPESKRYIDYKKAASIIQFLPSDISSVGLLVRPKKNDVFNIIHKTGVQWIQIIEPQDFSDVSSFPVSVIISKRIKDSDRGTFKLNGAKMILLDSYTPNELGGSGKRFDWSLIPDQIPRDKLILAGGITPENVKAALDQVKPAVIDVASGAEIAPGIKDLDKVRKLVEAVRWS